MSRKVLIVAPVHKVLIDRMEALGYTCVLGEEIGRPEALATIGQYEGLVTSTRLQVDREFIDRATLLKWVGRMGSGMEVIDVPYAREKGIACFSSPEGNANAVAEQALGMLLALQHRIFSAHVEMQQGLWLREENRGLEIEGLTAGVIGYGHNGSAFARKLCTMDVRVLALDKYKKGFAGPGIEECRDIDRIVEEADILSFHLPLSSETRHYFNDVLLDRMKKPFVLLNLSRGTIVSQQSLHRGLKNGKIKAAALDVWEKEPVSKMTDSEKVIFDELIAMPNFIGTPHIGGYTVQALYKMSAFLAQKIVEAVGNPAFGN
ncbi:NAD(P)-dependent oxidoreductase [Taibaiella koreensis]|uniref:NAD(P)-dependent oxidoreductase n=1 Tax=Taibaiella koreensis TaxID=1268548 RepID=UPI000E59959E|nr:NAD(P)-dependent oxidoreductase [Taibaiella koreensis]